MTPHIHIPSPCREDWNAMTPEVQGKHCAQCCKTVVDFTGWHQEDILHYLKVNAAQKTCGRFRAEQLNQPLPPVPECVQYISSSPMSFFRKIAAVIVLFFVVAATGCADTVTGEIAPVDTTLAQPVPAQATPPDSLHIINTATANDTLYMLGEPVMVAPAVDTAAQHIPGK